LVGLDSIYVDLSNVTSIGNDVGEEYLKLIKVGPNPSRGSVHVDFSSPAGRIVFRVFDLQGRIVCDQTQAKTVSGAGSFFWNGISSTGATVGEGVYFIELQNTERSIVQKIVIAR